MWHTLTLSVHVYHLFYSIISLVHHLKCLLSFCVFVSLASAVKFNHNLRDLFLGDNKLLSSDGQCLGAMLKGNEHLHLLDLRNNPLQV